MLWERQSPVPRSGFIVEFSLPQLVLVELFALDLELDVRPLSSLGGCSQGNVPPFQSLSRQLPSLRKVPLTCCHVSLSLLVLPSMWLAGRQHEVQLGMTHPPGPRPWPGALPSLPLCSLPCVGGAGGIRWASVTCLYHNHAVDLGQPLHSALAPLPDPCQASGSHWALWDEPCPSHVAANAMGDVCVCIWEGPKEAIPQWALLGLLFSMMAGPQAPWRIRTLPLALWRYRILAPGDWFLRNLGRPASAWPPFLVGGGACPVGTRTPVAS